MSFLTNLIPLPYRILAIALLVSAIAGTIYLQRVEIRHLSSVIAGKDVTIGEMRASVAERDALIQRQNLAVEGWRQAGLQNAKRAAEAEGRAAKIAEDAANRQLPVAPATHADCQERDSWLRSELNSLLLH